MNEREIEKSLEAISKSLDLLEKRFLSAQEYNSMFIETHELALKEFQARLSKLEKMML